MSCLRAQSISQSVSKMKKRLYFVCMKRPSLITRGKLGKRNDSSMIISNELGENNLYSFHIGLNSYIIFVVCI